MPLGNPSSTFIARANSGNPIADFLPNLVGGSNRLSSYDPRALAQSWGAIGSELSRQQVQSFNDQISFVGANRGVESAALSRDYGFSSQLNALSQQSNQIDIAGAARPNLPGGLFDVNQQGIDTSRLLLARELANQLTGLNIDSTSAFQGHERNLRGATQDATARGAVMTQGLRDTNRGINEDLWNQISQINVGREGARIGNERGTVSLNDRQAGLTETRASARDRVAQLNLNAKKLGISASQLSSTLQTGLSRLNLDAAISVNDINSQINSASAQTKQNALQLYGMLLEAGGYIPPISHR